MTEFKSQICTTVEQSDRLLGLGLKPETADMYYRTNWINAVAANDVIDLYEDDVIPAWSLHRLIELAYGNWKEDIAPVYLGNSYDMLIGRIEFQIKRGIFNKEYLEE